MWHKTGKYGTFLYLPCCLPASLKSWLTKGKACISNIRSICGPQKVVTRALFRFCYVGVFCFARLPKASILWTIKFPITVILWMWSSQALKILDIVPDQKRLPICERVSNKTWRWQILPMPVHTDPIFEPFDWKFVITVTVSETILMP